MAINVCKNGMQNDIFGIQIVMNYLTYYIKETESHHYLIVYCYFLFQFCLFVHVSLLNLILLCYKFKILNFI